MSNVPVGVAARPQQARRIGAGASPEAIRAHYDVGNDFFALWLDETMTYSCGLWEGVSSLLEAQINKLDHHIAAASASGAGVVLDIGCGWGSLLRRLTETHRVRQAVGLTLSDAQASYVRGLGLRGVDVLVEGWKAHRPESPYESIISVGAFEHFVRPEMSSAERVAEYRAFFSRCRSWLRRDGLMSLQTIAYGAGAFRGGAIASIFPESDLPRLGEIVESLDGLFDLVRLRNDCEDYSQTCRAWLERLRANRERAISLVGLPTTKHYEAFLDASARGFDAGVFHLLRLTLRPRFLPDGMQRQQA